MEVEQPNRCCTDRTKCAAEKSRERTGLRTHCDALHCITGGLHWICVHRCNVFVRLKCTDVVLCAVWMGRVEWIVPSRADEPKDHKRRMECRDAQSPSMCALGDLFRGKKTTPTTTLHHHSYLFIHM